MKKILGFGVEKVEGDNNLEILEATALYNEEMNISVELLTDGKTLYITVLNNGTWTFEGYYQEI